LERAATPNHDGSKPVAPNSTRSQRSASHHHHSRSVDAGAHDLFGAGARTGSEIEPTISGPAPGLAPEHFPKSGHGQTLSAYLHSINTNPLLYGLDLESNPQQQLYSIRMHALRSRAARRLILHLIAFVLYPPK